MAQRRRTNPPNLPTSSKGLTTYPSIKMAKIAPPPPGRAIAFRSAQLALWKRVRRSLRRLAISVGWFAAIVGVSLLPEQDNGFVVLLGITSTLACVGTFLFAIGGLIRTVRIWRALSNHEWSVYTAEGLSIRENLPVRMTLVGKDKARFPIRIRKTKRAETLRGLVVPDIWFVGDPAKGGILTVAGGGEMFRARRDQFMINASRPGKPSRPRKPPKPRKPVDPEKARRQAEKAAAQRKKWQEQAKARAAKLKANPPKTPTPKPARQPRLPRIRGGQKIKWQ